MNIDNNDSANYSANLLNVQLLNRVRYIAIAGQLSLIIIAIRYLDILLPLPELFSIFAFEISLQLFSTYRVKHALYISDKELFSQILLDSIILAGLVYFSGGANNPFIYLLLVSIALGTFMLTPRYLLLVTMGQLLLYSLLNIFQRSLELGDSSPLASFHLHLLGMWVNFALTAILIAVFGLLARLSMLRQEKQIQNLREKQLKDEQILSLGIMSASAAHELGTPLATMAIVVDDLSHDENTSQLIQEDMQLLAKQISNCRNIIQDLNEQSRHTRKQLTKQQNTDAVANTDNLKQQLQLIIENWLVYQPKIALAQNWDTNFENICHKLSISVEQAILNLMNNAADASLANNYHKIDISFSLNEQQIEIEITDYGKGLTPKLRASLGANIQESKKSDGLGWGLFLSNASIERVGGEVHLIETSSGGTLTRIKLPIDDFTEKSDNE